MNDFLAILEQGFKAYQAGNLIEAEGFCRQALFFDPENLDSLNLLGVVLSQSGRNEEAIEFLQKAINISPRDANLLNNIGQLYKAEGQLSNAFDAYSLAIKINPEFSEAHSNIANILVALEDNNKALEHYYRALEIDPSNLMARYNLATTLSLRNEHSQAVEVFRSILSVIPDHFEAHNNLAFSLLEQGFKDEALDHLDIALGINPEFSSAYANLGYLFAKLSDWESSLEHYKKATSLDPNRAEAWIGLGNAHESLGNSIDALDSFQFAVNADPEDGNALSALCNQLMGVCAWEELTPALEKLDAIDLRRKGGAKKLYENPLMSLTRTSDLQANAIVAWSWSEDVKLAVTGLEINFSFEKRRKLKSILNIGYLSSDFRKHVVGNITNDLIAMHNHEKFRIFAYSTGDDDGSKNRKFIKQNCKKFRDVNNHSSAEIAQLIYEDEVDILVDLNGYTAGSRLEIAALHPAPIQINYLGFPGTVGDFFDYIILDQVVLEPSEESRFCEKVIYIPPYYVINEQVPEVSLNLERKEFGLPENSFIFCSFNKPNKIEWVMFECWMNILNRIPNSVLWLIDDNSLATQNLKKAATSFGIEPERLVFANKIPKNQHLARHRLADLGLDTRLYNGGVTTWDALSAGLPVITLRGNNIPSRAAASMLTSIGMEELITFNLEAYQALAIELAEKVEKLDNIRDKISKNVKSSKLLNTELSVRNLEEAYQTVWKIFSDGNEPYSIKI